MMNISPITGLPTFNEKDVPFWTEMVGLTFRRLNAANLKRVSAFLHSPDLSDWSIAEWTNALCGEAGEAANIAKKILRKDGGDANFTALKDALAKELADTVIYADLCASRLGIDLGQAVRQKFNEVTDRLKTQGIDCKVYL